MFALLIALIAVVPGCMLGILALTSYLEDWLQHSGGRDTLRRARSQAPLPAAGSGPVRRWSRGGP